MLEEILKKGFAEMGLSVPEKAVGQFRQYYELLSERNKVMNLTAISGEDASARLHFLDCAALLKQADFKGKKVIDVGTGAGFPGLPLKIACPDIDLTLLDSLDKRVKFLRDCCEKLNLLDVNCIHCRAEEAPKEYRGGFDIALSRAVARLNLLSELCLPMVEKGGLFIAMKGTDCAEEVKDAEKGIALLGGKVLKKVDYLIPGTDISHSAVIIKKVADTPAKYPRRWAQIKKQPL